MFKISQIIALVLGLSAVAVNAAQNTKYEPEDGRKLFFVGQDLNAVGGKPPQNNVPITPVFGGGLTGVPPFNDGYVDHFPMPAGITSYSTIPELWGLDTIVDYGAGLLYADTYKEFEQFDGTMLALGLAFIGQSVPIAEGEFDAQIIYLANWIKNFGRPVFLRIGFEFDYGPNQYGGPRRFIPAYRHIVDVIRAQGVTNVAFVWQGLNQNSSSVYFPGPEYVDWIAFSAFARALRPSPTYTNGNMFHLAEIHDKPIMIAEMATNGTRLETANGEQVWSRYFEPWLDMYKNTDRIKAVAWINQDWQTQPLWESLRFWDNTNTRLQDNAIVKQRWTEEMETLPWINAGFEDVFDSVRMEDSLYDDASFDIIETVIEGGTGLRATYFNGTDFEEEILTIDETINIDLAGQTPHPEVPADNFSARWYGSIVAPNTGTYTILASSDDGMRVWANDEIRIDSWSIHRERTDYFKLDMVAGEPVPIVIEYYQTTAFAAAKLEWRGPNFARKFVAENYLFPADTPETIAPLEITDGTGLTTTYYDGTELETELTETVSTVDLSLGIGVSPLDSVPDDFFSIKWEGSLVAPVSGNFNFYFTVDNGVRIWFDDELMIDDWRSLSVREVSFNKAMEAGQPVKVRIEYFERRGPATARLEWESTSWAGFMPRQVIPANFLFPIGEEPQIIDDDTPADFSFAAASDVETSTIVESETVTISGINIPVDVSVTGGEFSINDGPFTSDAATLENGDTIKLRLTSSELMGTTTEASVTVGQGTATFSVTTVEADSIPDTFDLVDEINAPLSTEIISNEITVTGINVSISVSIDGGEFSINGGDFTSTAASVVDGDTLQVRLTSADTEATTTVATLTVGTISEEFSVQTEGIIGPDAFSFESVTDAATSIFVESEVVTISGLSGVSPITITGGEYSIDGGVYTDQEGSINNGQTLQLRVLTSGFNETSEAIVTVNDVTTGFAVSTEAEDTTPDAFAFTDIVDADLATVYTSAVITVTGINSSASISITGGLYSVNGGTFTSTAGSVVDGDQVQVQVESSSEFATEVSATLTIGGVSANYAVTTTVEDATPNSFMFESISNAALSTEYTSNTIVVSGINTAVTISIDSAEYSVNGSAFTSASTTVNSGDEVVVQLTSSAEFETSVSATLTIGGVSDTFLVTTLASDTTPDSFSFDSVTDAELSTEYTSNTITVSGINTAVAVSITGGEYSINGGVFADTASTVVEGDQISVRLTSADANEVSSTASLTVGGVSADFTITTEAAAPTRGDFGIENIGNGAGIIYFLDQGWTGRWNYICINDYCITGAKVGEYWELETTAQFAGGLVPGGSYNIQLKVQDDQSGQFISPNYPVIFE